MSDDGGVLSIADRTFLLAVRTWDAAGGQGLWPFFQPDRREPLQGAWARAVHCEPSSALETLKREHAAQVQPDLARVHPSWLVRGLSGETSAVRRAAIGASQEPQRATFRHALGLSEPELAPDFTPQPEVLRWVGALWTERLVGDVVGRADDALAIEVVTRLAPRYAVAVIRTAGLAKWAGARAPAPRLSPRGERWFPQFRAALAASGDRFQDFADRDVAAAQRKQRHTLARLGTLTLARLLSLADPYRVRWALQHIPYPAAKFVRSVMPPTPKGDPPWVDWEKRVLALAADRLRKEGPVSAHEGGPE